jgi:hypothetical protein
MICHSLNDAVIVGIYLSCRTIWIIDDRDADAGGSGNSRLVLRLVIPGPIVSLAGAFTQLAAETNGDPIAGF